jgi:hypothetical protein
MPRPVDEMIGELRNRWDSASRDTSTLTRASDLASRLPLVHRTGRAGQRWQSIFLDARLTGGAPGTQWERDVLGVDKATYFFWGCGAYPHGSVALLLESVPSESRCMATPFDTGGCEGGFFIRAGRALSEAESRSTLDRFTLDDGARVAEYGAHYITDLFDEPLEYVRRGQYSRPERPPVHELASPTDDRRAWTIEIRVDGDVAVPPERLKKVVLRRREQLRELPPRYRRLAAVSSREDDFGQGIADQVEQVLS